MVIFNDSDTVQPFKDWEYEKYTTVDKNGTERIGLRIKGNKKTITWWRNYNEIKHRRIGLVEGTKNFQLANQRNLIQALSALFILESTYITSKEPSSLEVKRSKLFMMEDCRKSNKVSN